MNRRESPSIALSFRGSVEALTELARAHCDVAGFHLQRSTAAPWRHLLEGKRIRAFVLARRRQGLMVAAGNPKAIRTPADLARKGLRFINRQPGSGTRILLDRMLAEARTDAGAIRGYDQEEFTHLAVAATVASGHADAGLGIEAAAVRYGLAFIPLAVETYYLGVRDVRLERTPVRRLIEQLASPALRRRIARLPGYDVGETGSSVDAEALLVEPREPPPPANAKAAATRSRRLR